MGEAMQKLAERLGRIEDELRQIKSMLKPNGQRPWWQEFAGIFKDSPIFDEVVKEIEKNRQADYAAARKPTKSPGKKPRLTAGSAAKAKKT